MGRNRLESSIDQVAGATTTAWELAWGVVILAEIIVAVLYWGTLTFEWGLDAWSLWRVHLVVLAAMVVLLVLHGLFVAALGVGAIAWLLLGSVWLTFKAIVTLDTEYFRSTDGTITTLVTVVVAVATTSLVTQSIQLTMRTVWQAYWGAMVVGGVVLVLLPAAVVAVLWLRGVVARIRAPAREDGKLDLSLNYGFWLVVLAAVASTATVALFSRVENIETASRGLRLAVLGLVAGAFVLRPVGMYVDFSRTGIYEGYRRRYLYLLFALVPVVGYLVSLYYLFRRVVTAPRRG